MNILKKHPVFFILMIILFISVFIKLQFILLSTGDPLLGDAPGFVRGARQMTAFYDSANREPLWILWVKVSAAHTAVPALLMRTGNIIFSLVNSLLVFLLIKKYLGDIHALTGTAFFSFIPYLFFSPVRAHRYEIYMFTLLAFTLWAVTARVLPSRAVITGIIASSAVLVRTEAIIIMLAGMLYFSLRKGPKPWFFIFAVSMIPLLTLAGPFYLNCYTEKGSFLHVLDRHASFYSSHEKTVSGEGRFLAENPYRASDTGTLQYLLGSPLKTAKRILGGYVQSLTGAARHMLSTPIDLSFLIYPAWLGLAALLFYRKTRLLFLAGSIYIIPHAYIITMRVAGHTSVDIRFAASAAPLLSFAAAAFSFAAADILSRLKKTLLSRFQN